MSFNKAREEKKWRAKKKTEEELLRKLGVSEAVIEELRRFDREQFNSDRRFYRYLEDIDGTRINVELFCIVPSYEITSIEQMLDDIENPKLLNRCWTILRTLSYSTFCKIQTTYLSLCF